MASKTSVFSSNFAINKLLFLKTSVDRGLTVVNLECFLFSMFLGGSLNMRGGLTLTT